MSSPWADARVEASLDYGNIDEELQRRLVRSTEIASKACQKHFRAIERTATQSARNTGQHWERAALRVSRAMENAETRSGKALSALSLHAQKEAGKLADAYQDSFRRMSRSATTQVGKIREELRSLTGPTIRIDFQATETMRRLRMLHREMQTYLTQHPLRLRIDLNTTATTRRLAELTRDRTIRVNTINTSTTNTSRNNDGGVGGVLKSSRALSGVTGILGSVTSAAGTTAKYIGLAGGAVVALAGSLPALTAALAACGAGLAAVGAVAGGAAIAGLSALALAAGTLKVGMSGVGDAFSALGAEASSGGGAAVDTAKQMEDATRALSRAVRDERDAQKDVSDARKSALERLEDYNNEAKGAALSEKEAVLDLKEARKDLAKGGFDDGDDRARAALRVEQAELRLATTRESNGDLESEIADARKKGVNGADEVVDANRRLEDATLAVKDAQYSLNQVGKDSGGGVDKAAEALAKLSPKAREFVLAVRSVKPAWDAMKSTVQDSLFSGLADRIAPLAATYLPMLGTAMTTVADGFNEGATSALDFANSGTGISVMGTLLGESSNMAANLGTTLGNLVPGLAAIAAGAGQAFSPLTDGMGSVVKGWSDRMVEMQQNGELKAFFEKAMDVAKQFGAVLGNIGGIISGIFNAANAAGSGLMGTVGQVLEGVNAFVNSAEGQSALTTFFSSMMAAVGAILPVLMQLAEIIGTQVAPIIADLITTIAPALGPLLDALSQGLTAAAPAFAALGQAVASLGPVLAPLLTALGEGIGALAPAFGPLAAAISSIVQAFTPLLPILGELITSFISFAGPILGMLFTALAPIAEALGKGLIKAFEALQPAIEPVGNLLEALSPIFTKIAEIAGTVLAELITALVPVLTTLADGFSQILIALTPILPILGDALIQIISALAPMIQEMAGIWLSVVEAILPLLPALIQIVASLLPPLIKLITALLPIIMMSAQLFSALVIAIAPVLVILANLIAKVAEVLAVIIDFVAKVIEKVVGFVSNVVGKFGELAQGISDKVGQAKDWVVEKFTAMIDWVKGLPQKITEATSNMWDGIKDAFKGALNWLIKKWNDFKIPAVKVAGVQITPEINFPDIPLLKAQGGLIRGPGGPTDDKIPAMLSDREFVTRAKVVAQRGALPFLRGFNSGAITMDDIRGGIPGFSGGGLVGREPYGLPAGTEGTDAFPQWVYALARRFNLKPSTYAGHQEKDGTNKGIDWSGSVPDMQRFAEYLAGTPDQVEQVIWSNPETGEQIGIADGQRVGPGTSQPGYYSADWADHQDHVHTRQSYALGETPSGGSDINNTTGATGSMGSAGGTPIGSGIGASGTGGSSSPSWGNSGGGSKFNSAADAKTGGITPVWVENWPSSMGGSTMSSDTGSYSSADTGGALTADTGAPSASMTDTIALVQNPDGTYSATDPEWDKLIKRESGGRADVVQGIQDVNSGGNEASGLFQIAKGTWASNGGTSFAPTAGEATAEQQAEIAAKIFNEQGGSPWGSGAGQNFGREDEELLRAGVQRAGSVPVTPEGTVPVTVTGSELPANSDPTAPPQLEYTPTTTTDSAYLANTTDGVYTDAGATGYESMPYGPDRANAWAGEQDFAGQAMGWAGDASKEILGQFAEPFGLTGYVDKGVDQMTEYLRQLVEQSKQQAPADVKFADTVNFHGMDPGKSKQQTTEGMTAVLETFRSG